MIGKCLPEQETSFVGHPDAMLALRRLGISLVVSDMRQT